MEGQLWGELTIDTKFERIIVPVTIRTAAGKFSIEPERIVFDDCFPVSIASFFIPITY